MKLIKMVLTGYYWKLIKLGGADNALFETQNWYWPVNIGNFIKLLLASKYWKLIKLELASNIGNS
jgi:hypothetical protein